MKQFNSFIKTVLCLFVLGYSLTSSAQVSLYSFTSSSTPYVPIVGGIAIGAENNDDHNFNNLPIGFNFCYNGVIYDRFSINNNGFIALGASIPASSYTNISTGTANNAIHIFNADLQSQAGVGELSYQTIGVAPNRTLVVQYKGYRGYLSVGDTLNGQIRINETLNTIDLHYGSCVMGATSRQTEVGLRGNSNADFNNRSVVFGTNTWATSIAGGTNAAKCDLQTAIVPVSGTRYSWAPPTPPIAPTTLTFTAVATNSMTVNWVDNSTDETNFYVLRSTDNVNFSLVGTVASASTATTGTPYLLAQTGLNNGTLYYYRIVSASPAICSTPLTGSQTTLPGTLCGTFAVGPTGNYTSLTAAFAAVVTNGVNCPVIFELQVAYVSAVETFPLIVPSLGSSNINTITVRPQVGATNLSITSAAANTIQFSGASWVIFDGRPGGLGTTRQLTISNTVTTGSAVSYINDANNITLNYLNVTGVTSSTTNGVISFGNSSTTAGNSDNTIQNCDLSDGATTPNNMIYSNNTFPNAFNVRNTITNNSISDFYAPALASNGVFINTVGNREWTITNNSFFQTASRTATAANVHTYINVNSANGYGYTITGNSCGGTAPLAAGTAATYLGAVASTMRVILINVGVGPTSIVSNNTIRNFNLTTTSSATVGPGIWSGINILGVGNYDVLNNTIGSTIANGSIVTSTTVSGGSTAGITSTCTGNVNITGNSIGGITANSSTNLISTSAVGIYITGGRNTVANNTVGSTTIADNIINSLNTSATQGLVTGIWSTSVLTSSFTGNTVSNLTNQYAGTSTASLTRGIVTTSGLNTISQNTISNLKSSAPNTGIDLNASVAGIVQGSATTGLPQVISNNTISNLSNIAATAAVSMNGIYFTGSTTFNHTISRNTITNIGSTSTGLAVINGINIFGGTSTYSNNMIALGLNNLGAPYVNGHEYNGIRKNAAINNNFYFNSVHITGANVVAGVAGNSAAFRRIATGADNLRNNIFANTRSNSTGTGVHYAINLNATTTLTSNRNNFYSTGTGAIFGIVGAITSSSLSAWQLANTLDANSFAVDPAFVSATDLHILVTPPVESSLESKGEVIAGIAIDYDNQVRPGPIGSVNGGGTLPDIGADEFDGFPVNTDMAAIGIASPLISGCKTTTETVTVTIQNVSAVTIDFALKPVTVSCSVTGPNPQVFTPVVINSGTLAGNATQNVVVSLANYDMSLAGTYIFNASTSVTGDGVPSNDAMGAVSINNNPGTASGPVNSVCAFASTNLTLTNSIPGAPIQWQSSPDGLAPWTNVLGATTAVSSVTPTDTTYYRAEVCGYFSNVILVNAQVILPPTTPSTTRCGAGPVTIVATDTLASPFTKWYNAPTGGSPIFTGGILNTNVVSTDTFYVSNSSGNPGGNHLVTMAAGNGSSGNVFPIKALNTITVTGLDIHCSSTLGTLTNWEIWYRPNDYLLTAGSHLSNVGWTQLAAVTGIPSAGPGVPTPITNALNVTIPAGQTYSFQIFATSGSVSYTNGTTLGALYNANLDLEVYQGHGGTAFAGMVNNPRVFNGYIKYSSGCESDRTPAIVTVTAPPAITLVSNPPSVVCAGTSATLSVTSPNDPNYTYTWQNPATLNVATGPTVIATPIAATTYTVTASDIGSGCINSTTVSLSVGVAPVVTASGTPTLVCPGDAVALTSNATNSSSATIGTGVVQNSTTSYPAPYGNFYWGAKHQMLVLASELTAAGLFPGPINSLTFSIASLGSPNPALDGFEIAMAPTALTSLPTTFQTAGMVVVAPATNYTPVVGPNVHTFSTPFVWDGVSNVIVQTCFNNASFTVNAVFNQTATAYASTVWLNQDAAGVCATTTGTTINQRPNMIFAGNPGFTYNYSWTPTPGVATPSAANTSLSAPSTSTVYTVTATNATNLCSATSTVSINLKPVITGTASASPTSICIGASSTWTGNVPLICGGNDATFAGTYAPATWSFTTTNSNGTVNAAGAPANIVLTTGNNNSGTPGYTDYAHTITCAGTVTFDWAYNTTGIPFVEQPMYRINAGAYTVMPGFNVGGANTQTGTASIPVAAGDVLTLSAYTLINDLTTCSVTISNFSAPSLPISGTVTWYDAATGGNLMSAGANPITETPVSSGTTTYYAQFTTSNPQGCTNPVRTPVPVTVNALPTVTATATPAAICIGGSSVLTGGGASTYVWDVVNADPYTVSPAATTSYTVQGTDANGCINTASTTVTVNALPTPTATATPAAICIGGTTSLNTPITALTGPATDPGVICSPTYTTGTPFGDYINNVTFGAINNTTGAGPSPYFSFYATPVVNVIKGSTYPLTVQVGTFSSNDVAVFIDFNRDGDFVDLGESLGQVNNAGANAIIPFTIAIPATADLGYTRMRIREADQGGTIAPCGSLSFGETEDYQIDIQSAPTVAWSGPATIASASSATTNATPSTTGLLTYTVSVTDANGCTGTTTTDLTVNALPVITANPSTLDTCIGSTITLAGGGAGVGGSYTWTGSITDNTPFPISANTGYTVTGTDANGCSNTATSTVNVTALPTVFALAGGATTICEGATTSLVGFSPTPAVTFAWSPATTPATGTPVNASPLATTAYTISATDANGCVGTSTLNITVNPLPMVTATPTTQTVCENGTATVTGGGAGVGGTYAWSGLISDATPFTVTASATYTVTGTDGNNCSNTATAVVNMNAAPVVGATITPAIACNNTSATPTGSGASTYVWSGGLTDGQAFVATTGTSSYTVTGTDGAGCSATSSVSLTVNPASSDLALASATNASSTAGSTNGSNNQANATTLSYYTGSCNLIATVNAGATNLGPTTSTVDVNATTQVYNLQPYVNRWFQITPTTNGPATITFYLTQDDFTDYNVYATANSWPLLPTGPADLTGIGNLVVTKVDNAGFGNNPLVLAPTSVTWNATTSYWEVTVNTPGFSQFYFHSVNPGNAALPATITNFSGRKLNNSDMLEWTTASEQNNAYFNLQHGTDGVNFTTIAKVNSKATNGNSSSILNYNFENTKPQLGHNYYRLQQVDIDNNSTMNAKVVDIIWGTNGSTVSIYPNPTQDVLNIDLYTSKVQNTTVKVLDMSGRIVKQVQARSEAGMNKLSLSLGDIASGVYTVQVFENDQLTHVSKVKKND